MTRFAPRLLASLVFVLFNLSHVIEPANAARPSNSAVDCGGGLIAVSNTVPARGSVTVAMYDTRGARVATLLEDQDRAAGAYSLEWDGRADTGASASSGVYFARVDHNGATRTKKMVLLK